MCIRDRVVPTHAVNSIIGGSDAPPAVTVARSTAFAAAAEGCLLYTSDAADERSSVDLGGRRIIKKNNQITTGTTSQMQKKDTNTSMRSIEA